MSDNFFSPKQVAQALGVSESSLKRWCDKGLLGTQRTAGGHRRLSLAEVLQFLRETGQSVVRPELLNLPTLVGADDGAFERSRNLFCAALEEGDEEQCRRLVLNLYLSKRPIQQICDEVIAPAMLVVGKDWECGDLQVYQERRGCQIIEHVLFEIRTVLGTPAATAPRAIGGTPSGDPYRLPTSMVELTLREQGWRAENLGSNLPLETLCKAVEAIQPRLLWLSVSIIADLPSFLEQYAQLYAVARQHSTALVVGGIALNEAVRAQMQYAAHCDKLLHLVSFVQSLPHPAAGARPSAETSMN